MSEHAPRPRPPKKTATIEFRVATEDKDAFLDACEAEGKPASGVLREAMAHFVRHRRIAPSRWSRLMPNSVIAASLALAFAVQSADRLPGADRPYAIAEFDYYDLNSDGRITLHEYLRASGTVRELAGDAEGVRQAARRGGTFGRFLAHGVRSSRVLFDHPELIGEECWRAVEDGHLVDETREFHRIDANNDGIITPEEFGSYRLEGARIVFFNAMDANGDGVVTQEDYDIHANQIREQASELPSREERQLDPDTFNESTPDHVRICAPEFVRVSRENPRPPETFTRTDSALREGVMLEHLDLDGDGIITFEEYATVMERNWSRP